MESHHNLTAERVRVDKVIGKLESPRGALPPVNFTAEVRLSTVLKEWWVFDLECLCGGWCHYGYTVAVDLELDQELPRDFVGIPPRIYRFHLDSVLAFVLDLICVSCRVNCLIYSDFTLGES